MQAYRPFTAHKLLGVIYSLKVEHIDCVLFSLGNLGQACKAKVLVRCVLIYANLYSLQNLFELFIC